MQSLDNGYFAGRAYASRPGVQNCFSGQDDRLPLFARPGLNQPLQGRPGRLVSLLDNAQVANGQQADLMPVVVAYVGGQSSHHRPYLLLPPLGNGYRGQVFLKGQVDKAIFARPPFQQQAGVFAGVGQ